MEMDNSDFEDESADEEYCGDVEKNIESPSNDSDLEPEPTTSSTSTTVNAAVDEIISSNGTKWNKLT